MVKPVPMTGMWKVWTDWALGWLMSISVVGIPAAATS